MRSSRVAVKVVLGKAHLPEEQSTAPHTRSGSRRLTPRGYERVHHRGGGREDLQRVERVCDPVGPAPEAVGVPKERQVPLPRYVNNVRLSPA